jgi:3-hydroxyacyl-[acyl-carrier-protein] dehydratase
MPGVMLLETMAQASGWLIIGLTHFARMPFLAAFKEAKLRTFVTPGKKLTVNAEIAHEGSGFTVTRAEIRIDTKLICNAEITFRLVQFPNQSFRDEMQEVGAAIGLPMETAADG